MTDLRHLCEFCKKPLGASDETFVGFAGGGLVDALEDKKPRSLQAFCDISWRSPFSHGEGGSLENISLIDRREDDQFELYYCSTSCLRAFFAGRVDALENRIARWYEERMRWLLSRGEHDIAVSEWRRYFAVSLEEAERAIARLEKGSAASA